MFDTKYRMIVLAVLLNASLGVRAADCDGRLAPDLGRPTRLTELLGEKGFERLSPDDADPNVRRALESDPLWASAPAPTYARALDRVFVYFSSADLEAMASSREYAFVVAESLRGYARRSRAVQAHVFVKSNVYLTARWLHDRLRLLREGVPNLTTTAELKAEGDRLGLKVPIKMDLYLVVPAKVVPHDDPLDLRPSGRSRDSLFNPFDVGGGGTSARVLRLAEASDEIGSDWTEHQDEPGPDWRARTREAYAQLRAGDRTQNPFLHPPVHRVGDRVFEDEARTTPIGRVELHQYRVGPVTVIKTPVGYAAPFVPRGALRTRRTLIFLKGSQVVDLPENGPRGRSYAMNIGLWWVGPWEEVD